MIGVLAAFIGGMIGATITRSWVIGVVFAFCLGFIVDKITESGEDVR